MKVTSILLAAIAAFTTTSDAVQYDNNRQYPEWSEETFDKMGSLMFYANEHASSITEIVNTLLELTNDNDITVTLRKDEALSNTLTELKAALVKFDQIRRKLDA